MSNIYVRGVCIPVGVTASVSVGHGGALSIKRSTRRCVLCNATVNDGDSHCWRCGSKRLR